MSGKVSVSIDTQILLLTKIDVLLKLIKFVQPGVVEACKGFILSDEQLCQISDRLLESMKKGLSKSGHSTAAVKCFPTYVQDFPTGNGQ